MGKAIIFVLAVLALLSLAVISHIIPNPNAGLVSIQKDSLEPTEKWGQKISVRDITPEEQDAIGAGAHPIDLIKPFSFEKRAEAQSSPFRGWLARQ